jgi:hexosaminidase
MKKLSFLLVCIVFFTTAFSQSGSDDIAIIPQPVKVTRTTGYFTLPANIIVSASKAPEMVKITDGLKAVFSNTTGYKVTLDNGSAASIVLKLNTTPDNTSGNEGYTLSVKSNAVTITANKPAGIFYGVQTFMKLLPKEIDSKTLVTGVKWKAPCAEITDYPRFAWRGLMLDVSRHFFTKQQVKDFIDQMAKYKYNLLHMHLTDDEGWRIEIKSLPRLTSDAATKRVHKEGYWGTFSPPTPDEPRTEGGFYTQEDIKELIQYAKDRFIDIMPEVDIPGHSLAAVVAYPELSGTAGADKYQIISGEPFMDWPGPKGRIDNTLNPANEKVYPFLDKVFTEIAQLFPFPYIHIGGDECAKNFWEQSDAIKALMQRENLKTQEEVQSYFEKRVEKIVESKGKKVIGWDEILEGGLAPDAAVMSWRGIQGGIDAAKLGHEVVMSPTTFAYLDYMQGDPIVEPHVYATLLLKKAYSFEPVPDGVDPKYIKGGQANMWTEQAFNVRHLEYMVWPRALATAECLWSQKAAKNWDSFTSRVEKQFPRFDEAEVKYARSMFDPKFAAVKDSTTGKLSITITNELDGLDTYYSFDNSFPDNFYPKYTQPLTPPKDAVMLKVVNYRGKKQVGQIIAMPLAELQRRIDHKGEDE